MIYVVKMFDGRIVFLDEREYTAQMSEECCDIEELICRKDEDDE